MELATGDADTNASPFDHPERSRILARRPACTIVIPVRDEVDNIGSLLGEIVALDWTVAHEIIVVDDGSVDGTAEMVAGLARRLPSVRLVRHDRPSGQSAAIRTGVLFARAPVILTIDGDGQNDPGHLPTLAARLGEDERLGLVAGERARRKDTLGKRLASQAANAIRRRLLGDGTRDTGCGLKAIRRDVYLALPYFDGNHRYLPALVRREGYAIAHVPVVDRPRRHGRSKYGILDRALVGLPDLLGVMWLARRRRSRPNATEHRPS